MAQKRIGTTEETPTQPKSTGPPMLTHLLHPAPRPRKPATISYPTAALVLAAAKARGTARARPASEGPAAAEPARPPPPKVCRGDASDSTGSSNPTVSSMIMQGIDPAMASVLHRVHVQNNTVWETRPQLPAPPKATYGPVQSPQRRRPRDDPSAMAIPTRPETAGPSVRSAVPIQLGPTPELQRIGHLMKEELFDMAIALTRRQDLCIDTLEQNGANSMLHGTMETLQHGKCLVKIPIRALEIHKVVDHPH